MTIYNLGVIGLGWMGFTHSKAASRISKIYPELGRVKLRTAVSRSAGKRKEAETILGFEDTSADPATVINDPDIDIVSICTINNEQFDLAQQVIKAGKALWIEKPAGLTTSETSALAELAKTHQTPNAVGFNYRQAPAIMEMRNLIRKGNLGSIFSVSGSFDASYGADPLAPRTWRFQRDKAGGGASSDIFGHLVDLVAYTVGNIDELVATSRIRYPSRPEASQHHGHFSKASSGKPMAVDNDDEVFAAANLTNTNSEHPIDALLSASRVAYAQDNQLQIKVSGSKGSVRWNAERLNELTLTKLDEITGFSSTSRLLIAPGDNELSRFYDGPGFEVSFDDLKVIELANLLRAIGGICTSENANLNHAAYTSYVSAAVVSSDQSRQWQHIVR